MKPTDLQRKITALLEDEDDQFKVRRLRPMSQEVPGGPRHPPAPGEKLIPASNPPDTIDSTRALWDLESCLRAGKGQAVGTLLRYLNPIVVPSDMVRAIDYIYKNNLGRHSGEEGGFEKTSSLIMEMFDEIIKSGELNVIWRKALKVWHEKRAPTPGPKFTGDH